MRAPAHAPFAFRAGQVRGIIPRLGERPLREVHLRERGRNGARHVSAARRERLAIVSRNRDNRRPRHIRPNGPHGRRRAGARLAVPFGLVGGPRVSRACGKHGSGGQSACRWRLASQRRSILCLCCPDWTMFLAAYQAPSRSFVCSRVFARRSGMSGAPLAVFCRFLPRLFFSCFMPPCVAACEKRGEIRSKHKCKHRGSRRLPDRFFADGLHFALAVPKSNRNIA